MQYHQTSPSTESLIQVNQQCALQGEKRKLEQQEMEAASKILVSHPDFSLGGTETIAEEIIEEDIISTLSTFDVACTCDIINSNALYRIKRFANDSSAIKYLTGFDSYEHFKLILGILGPAAHELSYQSNELDVENELFVTLMKLRLAKEDYALSLDFGISRFVVARIVRTWINF